MELLTSYLLRLTGEPSAPLARFIERVRSVPRPAAEGGE